MAARLEPAVVPPKARHVPVAATIAVCAALGGLLSVLEGCHPGNADSEAIRGLVAKEVAAFNAKDLPALSEIWSKDKDILLFDVPPPGRFQGWDRIGPLWKGFFDKVSDVHLSVDAVQATSDGTLAFATYDWAMTGRLGSYALDDRGQATAIYRKEGGQWRLIHAHYSPVPPALAGQEKPAPPASGPTPRPEAAAPQAKPSPSPAGGSSPAPG